MTDRKEFELWISAPPFEHMCDKLSENSAWTGRYKRYETELAWESWQAGRAAEREACAKVCESRYMGDNNREDMEARRCAKAIRARSIEVK